MNLEKIFKKLRRLRFKRINGKSAALFLLNRKLPSLAGGRKDIGKITDLHLDKKQKSISFELSKSDVVHTLTIRNYRFIARKGLSQLTWDSMVFDGPEAERYKKAFSDVTHIEVPKNYISFMEAAL